VHHPHCELQYDHRHRLPQWSVRSSSATADSGRLCLTLPQRRFSPAASSNTPGLHRTHPKSTRPRVAVGRPDCGIRPHCEPSNPHSRLSLPGQHRRMPRFPPSRLVRRLPAWRHHVLARLRVKAGIAQPLTTTVCLASRLRTFAATSSYWKYFRQELATSRLPQSRRLSASAGPMGPFGPQHACAQTKPRSASSAFKYA